MSAALKWALGLTTALLVAATIALIAGDFACRVPRHRAALNISAAAGCLEFWIYRYQSAWSAILGAGGALIAAAIAWTSIRRQTAEQEKANKISELTFWQRRYDDGKAAFANARIGQVTAAAVREATALPHAPEWAHMDEIHRLIERGSFPFPILNIEGIEPEAIRFNRLAQLASDEFRTCEHRNPGARIKPHNRLGERLQEIAQMEERFTVLIDEIFAEVTKSSEVMRQIGARH